jgi:hypothetical protein
MTVCSGMGTMKNRKMTVLAAILFAMAMGFFVWPAYGPHVLAYLPLFGKNEVKAISINQDVTGRWVASVDYFFTGRPNGAALLIELASESGEKPSREYNQFQSRAYAVRGSHRASIFIERPSVPDEETTKRVTVKLISEAAAEQLVIDSKNLDTRIQWPDSKTWQLDKEIASKPRDEILKKATALIDSGDTRSLARAKWMIQRILRKDPANPLAVEQMIRVSAKANWTAQGIARLDSVEKIHQEVNALHNESAYEELDELAKNLRESKAVTASGYSALRVFHKAVNEDYLQLPPLSPQNLVTLESDRGVQSLQVGWAKKLPKSPAPQIRIAKTFVTAAWQIRGTGLASTVTEDQWKRYGALIRKAGAVLMECKSYCDADPEWYEEVIRIMSFGHTDPRELALIFSEGFKKFPEYAPIYWQMAIALSPKWGGSTQAVEAFASEVSSKFPKGEADAVYARLYTEIISGSSAFWSSQMSELKVSCERLIKGHDQIVSRYPTNYNYNTAALISRQCGNKDATKKFLEKIGNNADLTVWSASDFADTVVWAR